MKRVFMVKVGNLWATRGTDTHCVAFEKGSMWNMVGHAKSHITNTSGRSSYLGEDHPYKKNTPEILEFEIVRVVDDRASVSLPTNDPALADALENVGYLEQANKLRSAGVA